MIKCFLLVSLLIYSALAQRSSDDEPSKTWLTLDGERPVVIARGGFSGLFPDSSEFAYQNALTMGLSDLILYCDLQLSKDGIGLCQSDIRLENSTTIGAIYPKSQKTYNINGQDLHGWFALDYYFDQLTSGNITLVQSIFSRPSVFDGSLPPVAVEDVIGLRPPAFWLNVQYPSFYTQHKLSPASYIQKAVRLMGVNYISSPEIGFLKSLIGKVNKAKTKLIFRVLEAGTVEPTTKQTYGSILEDLASIKSFASGILIPKEYIWPVNKDRYLEQPTTLVADAHKQGLNVYASGFANDNPSSYNYSYDPTAEYLQFINNSQFTVDGFLTDFPPTASESIACLAQNKNVTKPIKGRALIITHNGASGVYAGSTDLAYQQAIDDGADIIDCSVQMSKDGVAFCLDSPDLMGDTNALTSFMSRSTMIPEIQSNSGIFSFDLTWSEIQTLKPQLTSPISETGLQRNPENKNKGKFITLFEFLNLAKTKAVTGILINIENAAYLASKKGLDITDIVSTALANATFDKQVAQQVLIQSDDTSVLSKFKSVPTYKRVLYIKEVIGSAPKQPVEEIKKYANAVNLPRTSIISIVDSFTSASTHVVDKMHAANISVYVSVLRNEFVTIAFDLFSDPMVEIATYFIGIGVDGIVTEYPATANAYMRSPCSNLSSDIEYPILPAEPGSLLSLVSSDVMPPAQAPAPALTIADVVDPPLPQVTNSSASPMPVTVPTASPQTSASAACAVDLGLCMGSIMVMILLLVGYY